ncbi:putative membrane protein [Microbacterium sp. 1154]|nr:putative membrane protein [Microbacterium sp. 1154]
MSTALRSAVPFSLPVPRLGGLVRRINAIPTMHVGAAALIVLVGGLLLSIATTSDPLWWQLHFSQLGIFGDISSAFFNTTLKVSGMIVVVFAFRVRRDVRRVGRGPVRRGAATVAFICLNVVGVNLALVGCIPLNTDKDLHDKVAGSMVLGFLALLLSAPFLFHRLGKRMAIGTGIATVWLIISIALFVSATINLALFETISCAAMFAWSGMFTHILASATAATSKQTTTPLASARHTPVRRARLSRARGAALTRPAPSAARPRRLAPAARPVVDGSPVGSGRALSPAGDIGHRPAEPARRSRRRVTASRPLRVSASRAARGGSAGARRRSSIRRALPLAPPAAHGAARSLPR